MWFLSACSLRFAVVFIGFVSYIAIATFQPIAVFQLASVCGQEAGSVDAPESSVRVDDQSGVDPSLPGALRWVPQDVDFFWGAFGIANQQSRFLESDFVRRITSTKVWESTLELFLKEWKDRKSDLARAKAILDNPSARDVRKFLYDLASEELFFYVDGNFSKSLKLWTELRPEIEQVFDAQISTELRADLIAKWIDQRLPALQLPNVVLGAKFSDRNAALSKIDEVEGLIRLGLAAVPDLRPFFQSLRRVEDQRGNRLVWTLKREGIPWDLIPETDLLDNESLQDLRRNLEGKSIQWTIGIVDEYFCISIGGDAAWMDHVGNAVSLSSHPEIELLVREASSMRDGALNPSKFTSLYFTSDGCVAGLQSLLLDGFFRRAAREFVLEKLSIYGKESDTFEWLTSVLDDAAWVDESIAAVVPRFRGMAQCGWIHEGGFEAFRIDRNPPYVMDGGARLQGSEGITKEPLLVLNLRLAQRPEFFAVSKEIVRRLRNRLREATLLDDSGWNLQPIIQLHQQIEAAWPSVELLTEVWEKQLLPGWNGEHLFVMDLGEADARRWLPSTIRNDLFLPVPGFAWVSGLRAPDVWGAGAIQVINWIAGKFPDWKLEEITLGTDVGFESGGWGAWGMPIDTPIGKGIVARNLRWAWIGFSNELFQRFAKFDSKALLEQEVDDDGSVSGWHPNPGASLVTLAHIDLGGWGRLVGVWLDLFVQQVPAGESGVLQIPPTKTGRKLEWTREDVKAFAEELGMLGALTSWSWVGEGERTYSRSIYKNASK